MITGGLNSIVIPFNASDETLYQLLNQVNGVFFTGGDLDLYDEKTKVPHPYTVTSQKIFQYAIEKNDNGIYFPLLGVC